MSRNNILVMLFVLLLSFYAQAAGTSPATGSVFNGGGPQAPAGSQVAVPLSSLSSCGTIIFGTSSVSNLNFYPAVPIGKFGQGAAGAAYQVSSGKNAYCYKATNQCSSNGSVRFGEADTAIALGNAGGVAGGTNYKDFSNTSTLFNTASSSNGTWNDFGLTGSLIVFEANKYPSAVIGATSSTQCLIRLDCCEF